MDHRDACEALGRVRAAEESMERLMDIGLPEHIRPTLGSVLGALTDLRDLLTEQAGGAR